MNNNKLLLNATLDEFTEAMATALGMAAMADKQVEISNASVKKHLVYGYAGLQKLLGVSHATVARLKRTGILDPAISQDGHIIVADADLVLDLLKVHKYNRKRYTNITKENYGSKRTNYPRDHDY